MRSLKIVNNEILSARTMLLRIKHPDSIPRRGANDERVIGSKFGRLNGADVLHLVGADLFGDLQSRKAERSQAMIA